MVIFDTNIIIDHLRQSERNDTLLMQIAQKILKENLALSQSSAFKNFMRVKARVRKKKRSISLPQLRR